jgi:hypothetical protein
MRKIFAIAVIALAGSTAFAAGDVYRWKDANGLWHYSDQPQPGAELVRGMRAPSAATAAAPAAAPTPSPPASPDSDTLPVSKEVAAQVRQETANAKAEQCKKNTEDYNKYVQARRIYKSDASGNKVYMTEAEMDAARLQARSARDLACGP